MAQPTAMRASKWMLSPPPPLQESPREATPPGLGRRNSAPSLRPPAQTSQPSSSAPSRARSRPSSRLSSRPSSRPSSASSVCSRKSLTQLHYESMQRETERRAEHMQRQQAAEARPTTGDYSPSLDKPAGGLPGARGDAGWSGSFPVGSGKPEAMPKRPYSAPFGYTGYVPRKFADNVIGCTYAQGGQRARQLVIDNRARRAGS
eukprot:TRINITY_DN10503_c0_g1_i1.p1 TRINITY_DN10503_c0_g1~~TRINITY_DN10503_c0_g1_i1.p1  ORF type:complete len:204 (-),score=25.46 TRINITY_DN10503_c0_g1_i1:79-690(-)